MTTNAPTPSGPPMQTLVEVDSRKRLVVPKDISSRMGWGKGGDSTNLLAVLDEPGALKVIRAENWREKIEERSHQLVAEGNEEARLVLEDRYKFFQLGPDRRFILSEEMQMHLGIIEEKSTRLYVEFFGSTVRIATSDYRNKRMVKMARMFEGLP